MEVIKSKIFIGISVSNWRIWRFAFFFCLFDWIVPILIWFERSLSPAQIRCQSCPWLLNRLRRKQYKGHKSARAVMVGSGLNGTCMFAVLKNSEHLMAFFFPYKPFSPFCRLILLVPLPYPSWFFSSEFLVLSLLCCYLLFSMLSFIRS